MEQELLDDIKEFRNALREAMENLHAKESNEHLILELRATKAELAALRENLAVFQMKQAGYGCRCCAGDALASADRQVRHITLVFSETFSLTRSREECDVRLYLW